MRTTPQHLAAEYRASGAWSEQRIGDLYASSAAVEPTRIAIVDPPNRAALDGASPRRLDWRSLSALSTQRWLRSPTRACDATTCW